MNHCAACNCTAMTLMLAMVDDDGGVWVCGECWRKAGYSEEWSLDEFSNDQTPKN